MSYLKNFFSLKKLGSSISFFSFWSNSEFSKKVYIAPGVRIKNSRIGDYTRLRHFSSIIHTNIGKFCSIGKNVRLGVGNHPTFLMSTNLIFYKRNPIRNDWVRPIKFAEYRPITIGNDVWVGEGAMIIGGVKVGNGAIIAARSLVTKDVPPYAVVGGMPAKIIKYRFCFDIIERLEEIQWWNFSDKLILSNLDIFTDHELTLDHLDRLRASKDENKCD